MSRGANAVANGNQLVDRVVTYARSVGLIAKTEVPCGKRLWDAQRYIDVMLCERDGCNPMGLECKFQMMPGSAEEKLLATLQDIESWHFPGLLVYEGPGFSRGLLRYLHKHPLAIRLAELPDRLNTQYAVGFRPIRLYAEDPDSHPELF